MKKQIKLKVEDVEFLLQNLDNSKIQNILLDEKQRRLIEEKRYRLEQYSVFLLKSELEEICDFLLDLLIREGLLSNDEPNSLGLYIESLIDIFNPYDFDDIE